MEAPRASARESWMEKPSPKRNEKRVTNFWFTKKL
jgi:hypothetical protein